MHYNLKYSHHCIFKLDWTNMHRKIPMIYFFEIKYMCYKWLAALDTWKSSHSFSHTFEQHCKLQGNDKKLVILFLKWMNSLWLKHIFVIATIYHLVVSPFEKRCKKSWNCPFLLNIWYAKSSVNNEISLINAVAHISLFQHVFILTQNIFTKGI